MATPRIRLDYNLLGTGTGPVVAEDLVEQDPNRVGGGWLRIYTEPLSSGASVQTVDGRGLPLLYRSTAQGLTIVGHFDHVTHGHTPGVGGVDHFSGFKGDFPSDCR
jgi:hypothetical protein